MSKDELKIVLEQHRLWLDSNGGKRADLRGVDLQRADLEGANLRYANLQGANLRYANLQGADLRYVDLRYVDLQGADLRGANLDYSCLPLWCGSKKMKVDKRIASQIAAHFCVLDCDDADYQAARTAILEFARMSHRANDLGLLGEIVKECNDVATPIDVALRKRIAELEGKIDQLTAHDATERHDDKSSNDTQKETFVYGKDSKPLPCPLCGNIVDGKESR